MAWRTAEGNQSPDRTVGSRLRKLGGLHAWIRVEAQSRLHLRELGMVFELRLMGSEGEEKLVVEETRSHGC